MGDTERGLFSHHHHSNEYAYQQVFNEPEQHEAKLSHELIGGAAAFAAMKAYEDKLAREGRPPSHKFGKEALAALAGFEVDRLAETKGMDAYSRHQAKKHAEEQAEHMYDAQYNRDAYQGGSSVPSYDGYGGPPEGGFRPYNEGGYGQQGEGDFGRQGGNYGGQGGYGQGQFGGQGGYGEGQFGGQGGYGAPQGGYGGAPQGNFY